jgi:hypothetical protein
LPLALATSVALIMRVFGNETLVRLAQLIVETDADARAF